MNPLWNGWPHPVAWAERGFGLSASYLSAACGLVSPLSAAKVPDFIWAKTLAGDVLLELETTGRGSGGGVDIVLFNAG